MKNLILLFFIIPMFSLKAQTDDSLLTYTDHFYFALDHFNKNRIAQLAGLPQTSQMLREAKRRIGKSSISRGKEV